MSHEETTDPDSLSERLDGLANGQRDRFLTELRAGRNPRIEDFFEGQGDLARPVILRTLLAAHLEWCRERGETPDAEDLRSRFPQDTPLIDEILDGNGPTVSNRHHGATNGDFELRVEPVTGEMVGDPTGLLRRYEISHIHAQGGLGVVYLAIDRELHREVALKQIRPEYSACEQSRARLLREAEVTARLEHPGIVPVYGIGYYEDGRPFYVMKFIRGERLKDAILRLHNIKPKTAPAHDPEESKKTLYTLHSLVGRLIDACHALAYAHNRQILHRDIKPDNIMLGPYDETLVVDWGLVKMIDDPNSHEYTEELTLRPQSDSGATPTKAGSKVGTFGYMSPEQAAGKLKDLRPASDVYSLGATLYFLLTGKTPSEIGRHQGSSERGRTGDFRKPSEVNPSVPPALEAICLKAMAFGPDDRYATAEDLAEDLERWRSDEPVAPYSEPTIDRVARWSRNHRTGLAAAAVLVVSATVGLGVLSAQEFRKNERISQEVAITRVAEAEERHAKEVAKDATAAALEDRAIARQDLKVTRESLRQLMGGLNEPSLAYLANSGAPRLSMAQSVLNLYQELIAKHPADPDVKYELALAYRTTANIARSVGVYQKAEELYVQSTDLLTTLQAESPGLDDYRVELAQTIVDHGSNLDMSGHPREAEIKQLRALEILDKRPGPRPGDDERYRRAEALGSMDLASSRLSMSKAIEAQPMTQKAIKILETLVKKPEASVFDQIYHLYALTNRAIASVEIGDREDASKDLDEAARIARELRKSPSGENPSLRYAQGMITCKQAWLFAIEKKHADSLKAYDMAAKQLISIYEGNFRTPFIEQSMAVAWLGRAEARLELLDSQPEPNQFKQIQLDLDKALFILNQAVKLWPEHPTYHVLLGQNLSAIGRLARINKQPDKVLQSLEQSLVQWRLASDLNQDQLEYKKSLAEVGEELKRLKVDQPAQGDGP